MPAGPRFVVPWVLRYAMSPYRVWHALVRRYRDPFFVRLPESPGTVATGRPDAVKAIVSADASTLVPWRIPATEALLTSDSIFLQAGDAHRATRRLLAPLFQPARHTEHCAAMAAVVHAELDALDAGPIVIQDLAQRLTVRIILAVLFGLHGGQRAARFHAAARRALDDSGPAFLYLRVLRGRFSRFARVIRALEDMRALVQDEIDLRRAALASCGTDDSGSPSPRGPRCASDPGRASGANRSIGANGPHGARDANRAAGSSGPSNEGGATGCPFSSAAAGSRDMLDQLMHARRPDGSALTDREIQVHLCDLVVAGHETTTVAIAWACYELCRHPDVMARVVDELDAHPQPCDTASLANLRYLEAVCHETLRVHPPLVFLTRQVARPLTVAGHDVPPGVGVSLVLPLIHGDPAIYPDPHAFRPERFLERGYGPEQYLPFGGGAKRCLGASFALQEMMIVLAGLLTRFTIRLFRDREIRPRARAITVAPAGGVKLVIERRARPRVTAAAAPAPRGGSCAR